MSVTQVNPVYEEISGVAVNWVTEAEEAALGSGSFQDSDTVPAAPFETYPGQKKPPCVIKFPREAEDLGFGPRTERRQRF